MNNTIFRFQVFLWVILVTCLISLYPPNVCAEKTDVVILRNHDVITGEIKELVRGKLKYKTDDMGTIYIEWGKVIHIKSQNRFEVELDSGAKFFGTIQKSEVKEEMVVGYGKITTAIDMNRVIRIVPIKSSFWDRVEGSVDIGFDITRADRASEWSMNANADYRTRKYFTKLGINSFFRTQENVEDTSRQYLTGLVHRFFGKKWSAIGLTNLEQNDELKLDLRGVLGGGLNRYIFQTSSSEFAITIGSMATGEKYQDEDDITYSAEMFTRLSYNIYRFQLPEIDFSITFGIVPSLTSWGRVRTSIDAFLKLELIKDFAVTTSMIPILPIRT